MSPTERVEMTEGTSFLVNRFEEYNQRYNKSVISNYADILRSVFREGRRSSGANNV